MRGPTHRDLSNREYVRWKAFLALAEGWSRDRIREYQLSELKRVCERAYEQTPGYKGLFDESGFEPYKINSLQDFESCPFSVKRHFQEKLDEFSSRHPDSFYVTTGGSTGIPMGMYRDPVSFARELASKAHQYHRVGWREGDRQFVIRGIPIETDDFTEFIEDLNELRCSTYQFVPERLRHYVQKAERYRPEWIRCYPSAGYLFARFLKEEGLSFPAVKGILCASEMLLDHQKQMMEEVFSARVFSHYGHYEMAALAGFCENTDDYHVLPQYGYVELIDEAGELVNTPGESGEIVATSFIMNSTPFIRYRTGDMAVFKSDGCDACGRPYQVWERVEGRRQEMIVSSTGRLISMTMLNMHDDIYDNLLQYQFRQSEKGKLEIRYVAKHVLSIDEEDQILKRLSVKLGDDFDVNMVPVRAIELTKRGKHRALIQELEVE